MICANSELREIQDPLTWFIDDPKLLMQLSEGGGAWFIVEMIATLSFYPHSRSLISNNN